MSSRTKCPNCGANRGLAEYNNGTYCFSCKKTAKEKSLVWGFMEREEKKELELPKDEKNSIPEDAFNWINEYLDISESDVFSPDPWFWSEKYKRLVFPQYIDGKMVAAWMRSVTGQPKWLFVGDKDAVFFYRYDTGCTCQSEWTTSCCPQESVCLVEDVVSAIKVSEVMDCIALGGTLIKDNIYSYIGNKNYKKVYIFLDPDGAGRKSTEEIRRQLSLLTDTVIIRGKKDPKAYDIVELKGLFND